MKEKKKNNWVRNMVFGFIDNTIEFSVILFELIILIAGIAMLFQEDTFGWGIAVLIVGTSIVFILPWLMLSIVDIRESLRTIAKNTAKETTIEKQD